MKQTAVEWLASNINEYTTKDEFYILLEQAKQMEKEQHGNTWDAAIQAHEDRGGVISRSLCDFEQFYNGNYGKETS